MTAIVFLFLSCFFIYVLSDLLSHSRRPHAQVCSENVASALEFAFWSASQ